MKVEMEGIDKIGITKEVEGCITNEDRGRYLYCVADSGERMSLGKIGIEGKEVYTIPYKDLCVVVHNCPHIPYKSEDNEIVKNWIIIHQKVVDAAWKRLGTILPLGFDTIIKGDKETGPEENIKNWLKEDYESLKRRIERVRGKAEYGVQISWDPKSIAKTIAETSPEVKKLNEEIKSKPKGVAYMYRQRLENILKKEIEAKADEYFRDFYNRIKKYVEDVQIEKTKKGDKDKQMLINLSCLVEKDKYKELGEELEEIEKMEGFSVRFTGPWPPYSFI